MTGNYLTVFDLDGVLLDSAPCMAYSWSKVQETHALHHLPFHTYFSKIGRPFYSILETLGIPVDPARYAAIHKAYCAASAESVDMSSLYDGVFPILVALRDAGHTLAIVTSKSEELTTMILRRFGVFDLISLVVCPDSEPSRSLPGKPAPDHLLHAMKELGFTQDRTVYIGDMPTDYECATSAGVRYVHAAYGYGGCPDRLAMRISSMNELPTVLSTVFYGKK